MYENEYRKLVVDAFEKGLAAGVLPPELTAPTRKSLRDHCINVFIERYSKKDEPLLQSFYGKRENADAYRIAIQNANAEEFRTLNNFLRDRSKGTSFKNICMLAWMIDFEPRPFREDLKMPIIATQNPESMSEPVTVHQAELPKASEPVFDGENPDDQTAVKSPEDSSGMRRSLVYVIALLMVGSLSAYYIFARFHPRENENGKCMIWTGERYQRVSCNYKSTDGSISPIPLDTGVLRRFKKIMKDDTLTANSIGKVFCVKIKGQYEYYTDSAEHPIDKNVRLRPLTQFIMNNNP